MVGVQPSFTVSLVSFGTHKITQINLPVPDLSSPVSTSRLDIL